MNRSRSDRRLALLAAVVAAAPAVTFATDYTWLPFAGGAYTWTDAGNWNPAGGPIGGADSGLISGAAAGAMTINLAGTTSVGTLTLGSTSAFPIEIAGAGGTLTYAAAGTIISVGATPSVISAPLSLANNVTIDAASTTNLVFTGPIEQTGGNRSVTNNLPAGRQLTLSGPITITEAASSTARVFNITGSGTTLVSGTFSNGVATLNGGVSIGGTNAGSPRPTVVITDPQSHTGATTLNRGTLVISSSTAFGGGTFTFGGQAAFFARNLVSTVDGLDITSPVSLANHLTVQGQNSVKFSGFFQQTNSRFIVNLLPADKTVTLDGATLSLANSFDNRTMTFDGPGTTIVNSPIINTTAAGGDPTVSGSIAKNGTGIVTINSGSSTYRGGNIINGGLLQFADLAATANSATVSVSAGGAVGLLSGSLDSGFLAKLAAHTGTSRGGLALASADATADLDFTSGSLSAAAIVNMSVGAVAGGVTYTGTITPDVSAGYRLGGGGTLTLPNSNQLTGARNVTITNGGTVVLASSNNFSGSTTVTGQWIVPTQQQAALDGQTALDQTAAAVRVNTTLVIADIAALGTSANDPENLVLNGGILRYTGPTAASGRLFTIAPNGATLDASGTGALDLTNSASLAVADAPAGTGSIAVGSVINGVNDTSNLALGMTVFGPNLPAGVTIIGITPNQIRLSGSGTAATASASLSFGNQNRNLNLTGSNTGANTLAAQLTDSAAGKLGVVKSGGGNWNLTNGNNTYTGGTTVNAGTLAVRRILNNGTTTINGGTLRISPGASVGDAGATSVFPEGQFSIAGGGSPVGRLDVGKQGVVFDYSTTTPAASIRALIASGRDANTWTGNGITSSDAAGSVNNHAVGYLESSSFSSGTFLGQAVDATAVLVRYTRLGDANLDGTTNIGDFSLLGANFNQPGVWGTGDFNYDGSTNIGDFSLLASNFNQVAAGDLPRGGLVPEPATLAAMSLAVGALSRRRARN